MKKIAFTVPVSACEQVKEAMYRAGAGRFNNYERQCWQTLGEGQWLPMKGANPAIGKEGILEKVQEFKVEMFCDDEYLDSAIKAMLAAHPYEGPQFEVYSIENRIVIKHA
jgi:structural toxin protein (hemagglutinin/hemolysin) RtxA